MVADSDTPSDPEPTPTTDAHAPTTRRLVSQLTAQRAALAVLVAATVVGAALRLVALDARPIHYDEGVHLIETWELLTDGTYTYTGYRHGPPLIYLSALLFNVVGTDITMARGLVAVLSLGMFPALYLFRDDFSPITISVAAVLLAVHPWILYAARFYRNDAFVAAAGLLALALYAHGHQRDWTRRTQGLAVALGVAVAVTLAAKEIGYLIVATLLGGVLVVAHFDGRFTDRSWAAARRDYLPTRFVALAGGVVAVALVALFSGWPPDPTRAHVYWQDGLEVWMTRSSEAHKDGEVTYYVSRLVRDTPLVFAFALVGCLGTLRRTTASWLRWPLLGWVVFVGLVLSFHDHQWLWLMSHVFVPVAVLAGCGVADLGHALHVAVVRSPAAYRAVRERIPRRKAPSDWGATTGRQTTASDGDGQEWTARLRRARPTMRAVSVIVVAALLVVPVVMGAAGGDPRSVEGVTTSGAPDGERDAFTAARAMAAESGCVVVRGPDISGHPAEWYLRETPATSVAEWNASTIQGDRILVGGPDLQTVLENASWDGSVDAMPSRHQTLYVARPTTCGG